MNYCGLKVLAFSIVTDKVVLEYDQEESSNHEEIVKIANLTDKQKSVFRTYWSNIWPKSFIDAVLNTEN